MARHFPPMLGRKLVGTGRTGKYEIPLSRVYHHHVVYNLRNLDCVGEITIDRVALIRNDGIVIYSGPPIELVRDPATQEVIEKVPITEPLQPHTGMRMHTLNFMKDPEASDPERWLTSLEAFNLPNREYTLEVKWSAPWRCVPLDGWVLHYHNSELPTSRCRSHRPPCWK